MITHHMTPVTQQNNQRCTQPPHQGPHREIGMEVNQVPDEQRNAPPRSWVCRVLHKGRGHKILENILGNQLGKQCCKVFGGKTAQHATHFRDDILGSFQPILFGKLGRTFVASSCHMWCTKHLGSKCVRTSLQKGSGPTLLHRLA